VARIGLAGGYFHPTTGYSLPLAAANAIAIADYCAGQNMECMMGCMLEGGISAAAAVHLAIAKSSVISRIDLDGPSLGCFDPIDGNVRFDDAVISVSDRPGLGIQAPANISWFE